MAYIEYWPEERIAEEDRVPDRDNILRIHGINARVMRRHYDLYIDVMRGSANLSRMRREMIAVTVSALNECHY